MLIVGLNSDASVRQVKGEGRPVTVESERAELLSALECVDAVVIFDEPTPDLIIKRLQPDVLVKGEDWAGNVVGSDWVEKHGGQVVLATLVPGRSTTAILERAADRAGAARKEG